MKKIIILLILILTISGCSTKKEIKETNSNINDTATNETETKEEEPVYIDNNPIKIGIYENNKLVSSYQTTKGNMKDIASFYAYYTNDEALISTKDKINWNHYYSMYQEIDNYKTGFYIKFEAENKIFEKTILDPTSQFALSPYLYIYLYDDINQPDNTWYSHLEEKDVNDNTIYSSIKLFLADKGTEITSPITFTAFTYDEDDFDESGNYRGISSYTIEIKLT